ncbi:hypothetical protein B0H14DRAFT_2628456 [Mycena olivaceomarginata]|nr:hypothetical protein B0H14DRAFT_2628456 [Mycena olivaceomarginata]
MVRNAVNTFPRANLRNRNDVGKKFRPSLKAGIYGKFVDDPTIAMLAGAEEAAAAAILRARLAARWASKTSKSLGPTAMTGADFLDEDLVPNTFLEDMMVVTVDDLLAFFTFEKFDNAPVEVTVAEVAVHVAPLVLGREPEAGLHEGCPSIEVGREGNNPTHLNCHIGNVVTRESSDAVESCIPGLAASEAVVFECSGRPLVNMFRDLLVP